jgi:signal peptidase I
MHDYDTTDASTADESRSRQSVGSFLRELPILLLVAFLLAFLLRTFVLQVFYNPSSTMEPTLRVDDRMVVEKVTYRFREPERGEIVVFEGDSFGTIDPDLTVGERVIRGVGQFLGVVPASARDFVKRVIGLPGDQILIEDGQVFVNGEPLDEPYVLFDDGSDFGPVTVPDDSLFFLGDNRPNSSDSRRSLGMVPEAHVVGRAVVIIWPMSHADRLTGVEHDVSDVASGTE